MKIEKEDLTLTLEKEEEQALALNIIDKYDRFEESRSTQLSDIKEIREAIYGSTIPKINAWASKMQLPEIYELAQTLKSHIGQNLYSHPESMFDVSGTTPQTQSFANKQKAMLVNTFESMKIEEELEKVIDGIVETGETTLFVGWETKVKQTRRAQTLEEQILNPSEQGFVVEEKVVYDNAKIRHIKAEDFVFDKNNTSNWDSCAKIYRTYATLDEIQSDNAYNLLTDEKIELLKGVVANNKTTSADKSKLGKKLELLE